MPDSWQAQPAPSGYAIIARVDHGLLTRARRANTAVIVLGIALAVLGLGGVWFALAQHGRIVAAVFAGVLVLLAVLLVIVAIRRGRRLSRLGARSTEPVIRVDDHGIALHGLPSLPWAEILFVVLTDHRKQLDRRLRVPLWGWASLLAARAGNATLGGEIGARDGEAWRAACTSDEQRAEITLASTFPDGRTPGSAWTYLDVALSEATSLEVMRVLAAQARARGIPHGTVDDLFGLMRIKGPLVDPKWK